MKLTLPILSNIAHEQGAENLQSISSLKLSKREISTIDDMSVCVELKRLDLSENDLDHPENLAGIRRLDLTWLNLSKNQFSEAPPGTVCQIMKNLSVLNMSHNQVSRITSLVGINLRALVLSDNQIRLIEPDVFSNMTQLNTLILSNNQLESFPKLSALKQLKTLALAHNQIRTLPDLSPYTSLQQLRLNDNKISSISLEVIRNQDAMNVWSQLDLLDLGNNRLRQEDETFESLQQLHTTNLNLKGNPVVSRFYPEGQKGVSDDYRDVITTLIPSLRILDSHRFDPAFLARKQKRLALELKRRIKEEKTKPNGKHISKAIVFGEQVEKEEKEEKVSEKSQKVEKVPKKRRQEDDTQVSSKRLKKDKKPEDAGIKPVKKSGQKPTEKQNKTKKDVPVEIKQKSTKEKPRKVLKVEKAPEKPKPIPVEPTEEVRSGVVAVVAGKKKVTSNFDPDQVKEQDLKLTGWD